MGQEKIGYIYLGWPIDESSLDAILVQILDGACKLDAKSGAANKLHRFGRQAYQNSNWFRIDVN